MLANTNNQPGNNMKLGASKTGMPMGMNRPQKVASGDFGSPGQQRSTILSSGANGTGLWVHQTASQAKIENGGPNNLPPIKSGGSNRGTPVNTNKPPRQSMIPSAELQAERSLVQMLEKKYQEAMQESDAS